jgi:hypothetical protein
MSGTDTMAAVGVSSGDTGRIVERHLGRASTNRGSMSRKTVALLATAVAIVGLGVAAFFLLRPSSPNSASVDKLTGPASLPSGQTVALASEQPQKPGQASTPGRGPRQSVAATSPASFRPSRTYALDERTLAAVPRVTEGLVVAQFVELDTKAKTATMRAVEFSLAMQIDVAHAPAHLTMPAGSLFEGELSKALLSKLTTDASVRAALTKGSTTQLTVRVGGRRGSPRIEILSVGSNKGGSGT